MARDLVRIGERERGGGRERKRERKGVCVCERERERERQRARERERKRQREYTCSTPLSARPATLEGAEKLSLSFSLGTGP